MTHILLALVMLTCQEPDMIRVDLRTTAVSGRFVILDQGQEAGLEPGDRVFLMPYTHPRAEAVVRTVTLRTARAEVVGALLGIETGIPGEAFVPAARVTASGQTGDHAPWTDADEGWEPGMPLLTNTYSTSSKDRETRWSGRVSAHLDWTEDRQGAGQEHFLGRTGVDLLVENPFSNGGELQFDAEYFDRSFDSGADSEDKGRLRLDRLSYNWGGTREDAERWEVGRFLQHEFPEFGLLDGVEFGHRLDSGDRVGASVGFIPELSEDLTTGDDLQTAVFYRHLRGDDDELSLGAGFQKTWHEGDRDRDLLVTTFDYRPNRRLFLYAGAWVDYYGSGDVIKDDGFELTEMRGGVTYSAPSGSGIGLNASRVRWPELLRFEFTALPADELRDNERERVGLHAWTQLRKDVRLSGRIDYWGDDEDQGGGGEVRVALRDMLYDNGDVSAALFTSDGEFSSVNGLRLGATHRFQTSYLRFDFDIVRFDQENFDGAQAELWHQTLRASWDKTFGRDWNLSLYGSSRFGDEQDSTNLGLILTRRF